MSARRWVLMTTDVASSTACSLGSAASQLDGRVGADGGGEDFRGAGGVFHNEWNQFAQAQHGLRWSVIRHRAAAERGVFPAAGDLRGGVAPDSKKTGRTPAACS